MSIEIAYLNSDMLENLNQGDELILKKNNLSKMEKDYLNNLTERVFTKTFETFPISIHSENRMNVLHTDSGEGKTVIIYLDIEGESKLCFPTLGKEIELKNGLVLIFDAKLPHRIKGNNSRRKMIGPMGIDHIDGTFGKVGAWTIYCALCGGFGSSYGGSRDFKLVETIMKYMHGVFTLKKNGKWIGSDVMILRKTPLTLKVISDGVPHIIDMKGNSTPVNRYFTKKKEEIIGGIKFLNHLLKDKVNYKWVEQNAFVTLTGNLNNNSKINTDDFDGLSEYNTITKEDGDYDEYNTGILVHKLCHKIIKEHYKGKLSNKKLNSLLPYIYLDGSSLSQNRYLNKYRHTAQQPSDEIEYYIKGKIPEFMYNQSTDKQKRDLKRHVIDVHKKNLKHTKIEILTNKKPNRSRKTSRKSSRKTSRKTSRKDRPSPSTSATQVAVGKKKRGNDGKMWIVKSNKNGVHRWVRI